MTIHVAIADDHQLFIDGIKLILTKEIDISIISEALNGLELIKNIEKGPLPNVIITDIRMPVMDGIEACAIVKKHYDKATDKEKAIKEIIELDYTNPEVIEAAEYA